MKSGRIYGEGVKGLVKDVSYIKKDTNTLYNDIISNEDLKYIKLYGFKNDKIIKLKINKEEIIDLIKDKEDFIVKEFKKRFYFNNKNNFYNELKGFTKILKIFNNSLTKYTTIKHIFIYQNIKIYGMSFDDKYYTFSSKCYNTIDNIKMTNKLFKKFIKNIFETLLILQKRNYIHNDLKPDNIIYCHDYFKIIDWELSRDIKSKPDSLLYSGNFRYNHPIKLYLKLPFFQLITYKMIKYIELNLFKKDYLHKKHMKEYEKRTDESYNHIMNLNLSKKEIHNIYTKYFDIYSFALIIISIADKNKLKIPIKLINKLLYKFEK